MSEPVAYSQAEAEEIYRSGYDNGFAEGYRAGESDGHDQALAGYLDSLPAEAFGARLPWVSGETLRARLASPTAAAELPQRTGRWGSRCESLGRAPATPWQQLVPGTREVTPQPASRRR